MAYVKVADVQGNTYNSNLGDTAGGMESARKAVAHAEPLYKKAPSAENAYVLGRAYLVQAILIHSSDKIAGAEEYYKRAAEMFERATAGHPDLNCQTPHIEALSHLGDLYGLEGFANLGRSQESGDKRLAVADGLRQLGESELAAGDARSALAQEQKALAMFRDMPEEARDETLKLDIVRAHVTAGDAELALGEKHEAIEDFQVGAKVADELVAEDQSEAYNRLDRARVKMLLAQALAANGQCREAAMSLEQISSEWKALREMGIVPRAEWEEAQRVVAERTCR